MGANVLPLKSRSVSRKTVVPSKLVPCLTEFEKLNIASIAVIVTLAPPKTRFGVKIRRKNVQKRKAFLGDESEEGIF